jgi:hypothetical protein
MVKLLSEMFSSQEKWMFAICFCLFIALVLMIYQLYLFIESVITDVIYYHYKTKAIKQLKKVLRQIKIESELSYVEQFEMLYTAIKEGEKEKNVPALANGVKSVSGLGLYFNNVKEVVLKNVKVENADGEPFIFIDCQKTQII